MPGPKPIDMEVSEEARQGLERIASRHTSRQQIALRARLILRMAEGQRNSKIARELQVQLNTVRLWRQRWVDLWPLPLDELSVEERLEDLPRPGAPTRITADQRCQMEQLACAAPEQAGRPISQWTNRELADELVKRGIVESISPRHAGRLLKKGGSSRI